MNMCVLKEYTTDVCKNGNMIHNNFIFANLYYINCFKMFAIGR